MDNKYRFGRIDVNCEGYDHPADPYILRGSCGVCIFPPVIDSVEPFAIVRFHTTSLPY